MAFELENAIPWGRSFEEYVRMFSLTEDDLKRSILGCSDGPAAFNAALTRRGGKIISFDPIYQFSAEEISGRIQECLPVVAGQLEENRSEFVWNEQIPDVSSLCRLRETAMQQFLSDFPDGLEQGRYLTGSLPNLSARDRSFDLAVCSHFLFLYDFGGREFHLESIHELLRIASEIRIFPIVQLNGECSPFVDATIEAACAHGKQARIIDVDYEFQRGANQMLKIW